MAIQLSTLKPNKNNPRKISAEALDRLCTSIERDSIFMELRPIVVDEKNIILGGNQRYTACKKLGYTEIPDQWVKVARGITDDQRKRFVIIDNSPDGMSGMWDAEILQVDYDKEFLSDIGLDLDSIIKQFEPTDLKTEFEEFDEDMPYDYCCPKCDYKWSGKPNG